MALISCPECSTSVSDKAVSCPSCGCPIAKATASADIGRPTIAQQAAPAAVTIGKSRGTHIILGLLFGTLGFHNFYAGHNLRGGIKIGLVLLTLLLDGVSGFRTGFSLIVMVCFTLWALGEIVFVTEDAAGRRMA